MTAQPLYTTQILRLAASLDEPSALEREDGRAEARSPTCGSRIVTAVQLDSQGRIAGLSQQVHACAFGQASAALVEQRAPGCSKSQVEAAAEALGEWLGGGSADAPWNMAALAPARGRSARHGAILLPLRALIAAIEAAR